MTSRAPKIGSEIILPADVEDIPRLAEVIANRDKELAERIEELDDVVDNFGISGLDFLGSFNEILNPGFEDNGSTTVFDEWAENGAGTFSKNTANQRSGLLCASVVQDATLGTYYSQDFTPSGSGVTYSLQFWSYGETHNPRCRVRQGGSNILAMTGTGVTGAWGVSSHTFTTTGTGDVTIELRPPAVDAKEVLFDDVLVMESVTYTGVDQYVGQILRLLAQLTGEW